MQKLSDLNPDDLVEVHCRTCHKKTPINHVKLSKRLPQTTIEHVKQQARCEGCNSCEHRFPGSVEVRIIIEPSDTS